MMINRMVPRPMYMASPGSRDGRLVRARRAPFLPSDARSHRRPVLSTATAFRTVVLLGGKTATGIRVPPEVVAGLGSGKKPAVRFGMLREGRSG